MSKARKRSRSPKMCRVSLSPSVDPDDYQPRDAAVRSEVLACSRDTYLFSRSYTASMEREHDNYDRFSISVLRPCMNAVVVVYLCRRRCLSHDALRAGYTGKLHRRQRYGSPLQLVVQFPIGSTGRLLHGFELSRFHYRYTVRYAELDELLYVATRISSHIYSI